MDSVDGVHYAELRDVGERLRRREIRSVDVTTALLDRIAHLDRELHSSRLVLPARALDRARRADLELDRGHWRGPLHGVPVGVKDLLWMEGLPTSAGMGLPRAPIASEDSTVVTRLESAGAVIVAKHHLTEGATLVHHASFARPVNPWRSSHWTGVSSSGSGVAVAAGLCFAAIGSDTTGSIRMPSAANNLTAIKPTWGRVSRHGVVPLAESFDHIGPLARSIGDAAAVLAAIAGHDRADPTTLPDAVPDYLAQLDAGVHGMTLGIDWTFAATGRAAEIVDALEATRGVLERAGMRVRDVRFPWTDAEEAACAAIIPAQIALAHERDFRRHRDAYGRMLRADVEEGLLISGHDVARAALVRARFAGSLRELFDEIDVLLLPGMSWPLPSWRHIEAMENGSIPIAEDFTRFYTPFNFAGTPTVSLPAGVGGTGLPVGVQLAGPWLSEAALIRAARAFQKATDFHRRHPDS